MDHYGNKQADILAVAGAKILQPSAYTISSYSQSFKNTAEQQTRLVAIMRKRWELCIKLGIQSPDDTIDEVEPATNDVSDNLNNCNDNLEDSSPIILSDIFIKPLPEDHDFQLPEFLWNAPEVLFHPLYKLISY